MVMPIEIAGQDNSNPTLTDEALYFHSNVCEDKRRDDVTDRPGASAKLQINAAIIAGALIFLTISSFLPSSSLFLSSLPYVRITLSVPYVSTNNKQIID